MLQRAAQTDPLNSVNARNYDANRSAEYGAGSLNGVAPVIISASSRPDTGPSVRPQWAWPVSSQSPGWPGARPITGRESAKHGRDPIQGCASIPSPSG